MFFIDPLYIIIIAPGFLLSLYATIKVKATFFRYQSSFTNLTGAQAARKILDAAGLYHVDVVKTTGWLSDHYDPSRKVVRLSPEVYEGNNISAVSVAAHETGHALQDATSYTPLVLRNSAVPIASIGSNLSWILIFIGFLLGALSLVKIGVLLFTGVVIFQLITLPVEINASSRAKKLLVEHGIIEESRIGEVSKVLTAAALTYVAAAVTSILNLLYYLISLGLLSNRED